jgi:hypothetical protein
MTILCNGYDPARPCPVECQSQLLLDEFRTFRAEFNTFREELVEWKQDKGERLVKLETVVRPALQDNGQPCWRSSTDQRIASLEKAWTKVVAIGGAIWAIITLALHFIPWGK